MIREQTAKKTVYVLTVVLSIFFLVVGNRWATRNLVVFSGDGTHGITARVDKLLSYYATEPDPKATEPVETLRVTFEATVTRGEHKGRKVIGVQTADSYTPSRIRRVRTNDAVLLAEMEEIDPDKPERWVLQEFIRTDSLAALFFLFVALLVLFGRRKGVSTLLSLFFTCLAIFGVFVPSVLSGNNIYLSSSVVCTFIIVMTLLLVNGPNPKSFAAGMGCLGGVAVSGALVLVSGHFLELTGVVDEQSVFLLYLNSHNPIDLQAIVFSSIIIGALGAALDVSVSIASALSEIDETTERRSFRELLHSGMNIGRDIMGTMANTLILAYIGGSLSLVLLLITSSTSLMDLMNREIIVVEILQILVGSIGLLCTIPLTSLLSAFVYIRRKTPPTQL